MITKEQFIQFLKNQGCYDQYVANFNNNGEIDEPMDVYIDEMIKRELYSTLIGAAFVWIFTSEGHSYWYSINRKFINRFRLR